ncbi:hypothetical protein [Actinospongicola halichondriae]|uniref:hypothetical protein n=1 Tax=Actinospongicola halichondriae TaxID=3236844 RepID=UPI003D5CA020
MASSDSEMDLQWPDAGDDEADRRWSEETTISWEPTPEPAPAPAEPTVAPDAAAAPAPAPPVDRPVTTMRLRARTRPIVARPAPSPSELAARVEALADELRDARAEIAELRRSIDGLGQTD